MRAIVKRAAEDPSEANLAAMRPDLLRIAKLAADAERQFVEDMRRYVVLGFDPAAPGWDPLEGRPELRKAAMAFLRSEKAFETFAKMWVLKAAALAGVNDPNEQIEEKARWVAAKFRVPITLYNHVVEKIVQSGYNLSKKNRENTIWDIDIAFGIGDEHTIEGVSVRLVTGDRAIANAAEAAASTRLVYSYDEYRRALADGSFR